MADRFDDLEDNVPTVSNELIIRSYWNYLRAAFMGTADNPPQVCLFQGGPIVYAEPLAVWAEEHDEEERVTRSIWAKTAYRQIYKSGPMPNGLIGTGEIGYVLTHDSADK